MICTETFLPLTNDGDCILPYSENRIGALLAPVGLQFISMTQNGGVAPFPNAGWQILAGTDSQSGIMVWNKWGVLLRQAWYQISSGLLAGTTVYEIFGDPAELTGGPPAPLNLWNVTNQQVTYVQSQNRAFRGACQCGPLRDAIARIKSFARRLDSDSAADKSL